MRRFKICLLCVLLSLGGCRALRVAGEVLVVGSLIALEVAVESALCDECGHTQCCHCR